MTVVYFYQEALIFHPSKIAKDLPFNFDGNFEEIFLETDDGIELNSLLFKADSSKGVVLYLHGNAGGLDRWGSIADVYTDLNYDFFVFDYRGFGKSEGEIFGEEQFYNDAQLAYDFIQEKYHKDKITVIGYSIGTAAATMLAAENNPNQLILKAPYYNLTDITQRETFHLLPKFLLKYKFNTNEYLPKVACPVTIFHGNKDELIYYESSIQLKESFKTGDKLVTLDGAGHGNLNSNPDYLKELAHLLK